MHGTHVKQMQKRQHRAPASLQFIQSASRALRGQGHWSRHGQRERAGSKNSHLHGTSLLCEPSHCSTVAERTVDPLRLIAKHVQRRHRLGVCQWCDCRPLWSLIRSAPLETCQHLLIIFLFNLGEAKGLLLWLHEICWHLLDGCWARPLCGRGHRRLIIARRWRLGDLWQGD